jgi:hypothetical protein
MERKDINKRSDELLCSPDIEKIIIVLTEVLFKQTNKQI